MAGADGEALETIYAVYEAVLAAEEIEDSDTYLEQIPGYTPDDRFYYNGREVAQLYVGTYANKPVYQYTNPATSMRFMWVKLVPNSTFIPNRQLATVVMC